LFSETSHVVRYYVASIQLSLAGDLEANQSEEPGHGRGDGSGARRGQPAAVHKPPFPAHHETHVGIRQVSRLHLLTDERLQLIYNFSGDPPPKVITDSDTESMVSSVSGYTIGGKKKKR
jgi:hypothetical protein